MSRRHVTGWLLVLAFIVAVLPGVAAPDVESGTIRTADLESWLSYIASDETQGRAVFSTGLGLAAGYITNQLRAWRVTPAGDSGSYLQNVPVLGVKSTTHSTVTVQVGNKTRTFNDGGDIVFPKNAGRKQRLTIDRVEFAGYGLEIPAARHADITSRNPKGAAVVWLGVDGPKDIDPQKYRVLLSQRHRFAVEEGQAAAGIGPDVMSTSNPAPAQGSDGREAADGGDPDPALRADFITVERLDQTLPPTLGGRDAFFEFLFSQAPVKYEELKRRAAAREPLPEFRLDGVRLTITVDVDYEVVRTRFTPNIVAIVEGSDPALKDSYVAFGAHYDHVGYAEGEIRAGEVGSRHGHAPGRITPGTDQDRIWNGADDDGSGTVGLIALVRAFAEGPRPRRSLLFVWHTGEEAGRYGSLYFASHPVAPTERIAAMLNIDMIGRNRDDKPSESDTVYLVGSDRISTELHAISSAANSALSIPMKLNYEFNDPSDGESLYTRSDHFSYASKGIPVIFYTTGLHPDYHANTDEVSKIDFNKLSRVVHLVYETGARLANLDHLPVRDNKGARAGK